MLLLLPGHRLTGLEGLQTSWSDNTKFSSSSNVTTSTAGQVTLTATSSWYNTSWAYRRKITFDNSAQAENLTNFPVLVKLSSSNINYSNTQDSGQDIRFTDSDGTTLLSYEIEKWDETGSSFVWVKVPQIDASSSTDSIYMYYGNSSATDAQAATSVWSNGYSHVYHLNNSTTNSADGNTTATFPTNSIDATGQFAQGRAKQSPYTGNVLTATQDRATASAVTVEAWFKPDGFRNWDDVLQQGWVGNGLNLYVNATQNAIWGVATSTVQTNVTSATTLTDATWYFLSGTYNGTTSTLYLNGSSNGTPKTVSDAATDITSNIESIKDSDRGTVDEIRISSVARSAAWIAATYKSEADTFNTFASEEPQVQTSGTLTSSIFDTEQSSDFGTLTFSATTPSNTSVSVKVRTSSSSSMDGATDFSSCTAIATATDISSNSPCVTDGHRYIQYQLSLVSTDSTSTPTFQDLSIGFTYSGSILSLDSPSNNSYTNNERPSFKWKAVSSTTGLSKYTLEIDNGETNDFTINDIPLERTTDLETNKYIIRYENFSDSDATNNYISVTPRSSSEWSSDPSSGQNDGKLKEGKRTWKVKAVGSNEASSSRTLFVDRASPNASFIQINSTPFSATTTNSFSTTSKKPSIFGKITDPLSGDSSSATQNDSGPKVASGPKSIEVKLEKRNTFSEYELHTLSTLNLTESYFTSDNSKITDNSKQTSDKYSPFEFLPKEDLALGTYRLTVTGKDNVDNTSSSTSFTLNITTLAKITTPEEKQIIEKEIEEFKEESQEKIKEDLEITKPTEEVPPPSAIGTFTSEVVLRLRHTSEVVLEKVGNGIAFVFNTIGQGYNKITQHAPGVSKDVLTAVGNGVSTAANTTGKILNNAKEGIIDIAFFVGEKTQDISDRAGLAIINFTYNFVSEPTKIYDVKTIVLSPTSAKISWKTNHPANGKVNYGLDETYPLDVQSEKRVTDHEFDLTNLTPNTEYHFEVMSHNRNYVYDANRKFKTPGR